jgi:mannose-6-phosphate isomerase-like protein (cupin superfamily)
MNAWSSRRAAIDIDFDIATVRLNEGELLTVPKGEHHI